MEHSVKYAIGTYITTIVVSLNPADDEMYLIKLTGINLPRYSVDQDHKIFARAPEHLQTVARWPTDFLDISCVVSCWATRIFAGLLKLLYCIVATLVDNWSKIAKLCPWLDVQTTRGYIGFIAILLIDWLVFNANFSSISAISIRCHFIISIYITWHKKV